MARRFLTNLFAPKIGVVEQNGAGPSVLYIRSTDNIAADRTLTLNVSDADRSLTISGDVLMNQHVASTSSPTFASVTATLAPSSASHLTRKDYVDAADDSHQAAAENTAANAMMNHVIGSTSHHDADVIDVDTAAFTGVLDTGLQPDLQTILEAIEAHLTPTGVVAPFAGSTEPTGWLLCQGQAVSRTTYAALFAVIGTTYGAGDGSTTFNLPDLRSKFPVGKGTETWSDSLGETGGSKDAVVVDHSHDMTHGHADNFAVSSLGTTNVTSSSDSHSHTGTLTFPNPPAGLGTASGDVAKVGSGGYSRITRTGSISISSDAHTHTTNIAHGHSLTGSVTAFSGSTGPSGVSGANANLPPYVTLNYIIKV